MNFQMSKIYAIGLMLFLSSTITGQVLDTMLIINPSFEAIQEFNDTVPSAWFDCGSKGNTPPSIHENGKEQWGITQNTLFGTKYLSMVTRTNDTNEAIAQKLNKPLQAGKKYRFSIYLATSTTLESMVPGQVSKGKQRFDQPTTIRVWATNKLCRSGSLKKIPPGVEELLYTSSVVDHEDWREYIIDLAPKAEHDHILIEVFYKIPALVPTNGNVLIDNISSIVQVE